MDLFKRLMDAWKQATMPIWAHGLECEICQMTFVSAEAHVNYARRQRTIKQHEGKVPVLRGN